MTWRGDLRHGLSYRVMAIASHLRAIHRASALGERLAVGSAATTEACAAVEFGLVALPFFALLFAIIQIGLVFFAGQALEGAVATASRMIRTGQAQQQNFDAAKFKDQICAQIETLFNCPEPHRRRPDHKDLRRRRPVAADRQGHRQSQASIRNMLPATAATSSWSAPSTSGRCSPSCSASISSNLADGNHLLSATTAFRNEPFPWKSAGAGP